MHQGMESTPRGADGEGNGVDDDAAKRENAAPAADPMTLDIVINNVVSNFNLKCHLDLRRIALHGSNVEFRRENAMVTMKLRKPYTTATFWSSGKVTCTGATSEEMAKVAARKFARIVQNMGFRVSFNNFRITNVLGTCTMPFNIRIIDFSRNNMPTACYEPELHPGVTYKIKDPKATMKIFSTGSITVTAPSVSNVQAAIEFIFPLVYEYRNERPPPKNLKRKKKFNHLQGPPNRRLRNVMDSDVEEVDEDVDDFNDMDDYIEKVEEEEGNPDDQDLLFDTDEESDDEDATDSDKSWKPSSWKSKKK